MSKSLLISTIFGALLVTSTQADSQNAQGHIMNTIDANLTTRVHSKRCKFRDDHGNVYKAHCPHEYRKGSRKKRAGIGAGIGAATGAIIGGIAGGGRGAAIGAATGAAAGAIGGAASVKKCWKRDRFGRRVRVKCKQ